MKKKRVLTGLATISIMTVFLMTACGLSSEDARFESGKGTGVASASTIQFVRNNDGSIESSEVNEVEIQIEEDISQDAENLLKEVSKKGALFSVSAAGNGSSNQGKQPASFYSLSSIHEACDTRAKCQDNKAACVVYPDEDHNPYDVVWDYGEAWNSYVEACDWSLVFDAEYYKKEFPMLALQYHNDDELLLEHFATIGVHEGRQGCKDFNVEAYLSNCDIKIFNEFKGDIEGAYIYYMLNYETESSVDTLQKRDGSTPSKQLFHIYTAIQTDEIDGINKYRREVGAPEIELNEELCAFANYRSYVQRTEIRHKASEQRGHEWAINNQNKILECLNKINPNYTYYLENTITSYSKYVYNYALSYRDHKDHYEAMVRANNTVAAVSNSYYTDSASSEYDLFVDFK